MKQEYKELINQTIKEFDLPRYKEVPDVGFYLDQTVKYISNVFAVVPDMEITSSMISNYVKKGIIDRPTKKDSVSRKFMTEDDLSKIIKTVKCGAGSSRAIARQDNWWTRDLAIILMFITTGMRKTALSEIDINDINFTTNEIRVVDKEHETHTFNMPNILTDALIDWMYQREKILQGTDVAPLFISNRLKRMSPDSISLLVKKYTIEALGEPFSPHKIRAAFANIMLEHTGNIKIVADALRHKQIETTKIYLNNDEKKVNKKTVDIMNSIFK